jgi:hypothetical protein
VTRGDSFPERGHAVEAEGWTPAAHRHSRPAGREPARAGGKERGRSATDRRGAWALPPDAPVRIGVGPTEPRRAGQASTTPRPAPPRTLPERRGRCG